MLSSIHSFSKGYLYMDRLYTYDYKKVVKQ